MRRCGYRSAFILLLPALPGLISCGEPTANTRRKVPVGSVTVTPPSVTVQRGASQTFTATVRDTLGNIVTDRVVSWTSSQPAVVRVPAVAQGASVVVSALDVGGPVIITATAEEVPGTAEITVAPPPVATVELHGITEFAIEQTQAFSVTLRDADGNVVTGRDVTLRLKDASPAGAATLRMEGEFALVTGLIDGTVNVVATSEGVTASRTVTINPLDDPSDNESATAATNIGAISSGGTRTAQSIFGRNADQSDWYMATALDGNSCTSGTKTHTLRLTLTNIPVGRNYDLFVYHTPGGPLIASATNGGNAAEVIDVSKTGPCGTSLTFSVYIDVRRMSGTPSSSAYTLGLSVP